jgi:predicted outer membrane repeat protein
MDGGIITQNKASSNGGGVYVGNGGTFNMSSGSITNNIAEGFGGGVYVAGTFNIFTAAGGGAMITGVNGNIKNNEDSDNTGAGTPNVYLPSGSGGINIDENPGATGW